jgi:tetratricopeptide (TPR) repeat protein
MRRSRFVPLVLPALLLAAGTPSRAGAGQPTRENATKLPVSLPQLQAEIARDPKNPASHVALGLLYWDRNDYPKALAAFQHAVKVGPESAEAHNWLGVALSEKADLPGAIAALRKAVALDPTFGRAYTNLGAALAKSGDVAAAIDVFKQALTLEPNSLGARMNLGLALREQGDLDAALDHLRHVVSVDPANARMHYELGQTRRQTGDLAGAIASFERALELEPEMREGYYALGVSLKQQRAALSKPAPLESEALTRAREMATRGDFAAARAQLIDALRLDDRSAEAHNLLGFILGQQGDLASGMTHLERAVALRPDLAEARYNLGVALWYSAGGNSNPAANTAGGTVARIAAGSAAAQSSASSEQARAIAELREGVRLDPAAGAAHAFLGVALRERGELADARVSLQRAIALMPPTAAVYVDLGITYLRAGALEQALGQLEAGLNLPSPALPTPDWRGATSGLRDALGKHPGNADGHHVLGLVLGRSGAANAEVAAAFREAIRLRPDFAAAHNHLGLVLIQGGDDNAGIAALREAVRLRPDDAEARTNLGAALTPTDAAAAIRELEQAVTLAPTAVSALFNLAIAYGASSNPKHGVAKEIEYLRKAISLAPAFARAHVAMGKALLREGKVTDAIASLEEAARLEPSSGEAHYQLGLALSRAGRKGDAAAALKKGRELVAEEDKRQHAQLDLAEGRTAAPATPDAPAARAALTAPAAREAGAASAAPIADAARIAEFEADIRAGRFAEVEPRLAAYVKERPSSSWGWYALGYSQFAQQKIGESIQALAKSLQLDIRNAEAHKILGRNLMIIGRFDAAQVEFEQGLRYSPDSAELHYNLGKLFSIQDNWEPARKAFEAALVIDPSYVEAIDALGFALEALGDDAGAVSQYEKAVALNESRQGTLSSPHVNLSAFYNRTGDTTRALDHARKAIAIDPKSDRAWFQRAKADEREGRFAEAVGALNHAITLNTRASSYYYVLASLYRRLGDVEESKKALEMFTRLERESSELDKKRRSAP